MLSGRSVTAKRSRSEYLSVLGKRLELQRISRRVDKEHGPLLAWLADESHVWWDHELDLLLSKAFREELEIIDGQNDAEVWHRNVVAIDGIVRDRRTLGNEVRDDLMPEQVPIDPVGCRPALATAKNLAVEGACGLEVVDGDCQMEAWV
jgi:hypothetical protein